MLLERAKRIRVATFGPDHGLVAFTWQNLGATYRKLGRLDEAEAAFRQALAGFRTSPDYDYAVPASLSGLGNLLMQRQKYGEALPLYEESNARFEAHKVDGERLADIRFRLARALWHSGKDRKRGMELARWCRDFYASAGDMPKSVAEIDAWMADPTHATFEILK